MNRAWIRFWFGDDRKPPKNVRPELLAAWNRVEFGHWPIEVRVEHMRRIKGNHWILTPSDAVVLCDRFGLEVPLS